MEPKTKMVAQDLRKAHAIGDRIIDLIKDVRPPAAVAGVALALAATAQMAGCGPKAAKNLFDWYFAALEKAGRQS